MIPASYAPRDPPPDKTKPILGRSECPCTSSIVASGRSRAQPIKPDVHRRLVAACSNCPARRCRTYSAVQKTHDSIHTSTRSPLRAHCSGSCMSDAVRKQAEESMTARLRGTDSEMAAAKAVLVRLPDDVLARVDVQRQRLRRTGLTPSLSATIKMLVVRGLETVEAEARRRKR